MTNEACERQKDRVMAIKRQQASAGSTLVAPLPPLLLTEGGVPRRTSDEVKRVKILFLLLDYSNSP